MTKFRVRIVPCRICDRRTPVSGLIPVPAHRSRQRMERFTHHTTCYAGTMAVFWASNFMTLLSR